jgi:APA family basic amino acid/polyamine antiporter
VQSLERRLGLFSIIVISISSMVGSGIFVLPGIGFAITGPSIALAFVLAAITILPAAMSKAELATAMPTSGGTYVYIDRTFGPLAGTVSGLGLFLSILLKASFALVGLGAYFSVLSSFALMPTIMFFLVIIITLNIFGVGKVSSLLSISLGISLLGLIALMMLSSPIWNHNHLQPFMIHGWEGLGSATAIVFVSFAGVTKVAAIAEEVKDPERNLPRGILLSLLIVTILYFAISLTLGGVFPAKAVAGQIKPIHTLANTVGGPIVGTFIAIIAVLTMVNTSNAGVLAGSRFPFAMARDRLLPKFLGKLHPGFLTPVFSILLSGAIIATVLLTMNVVKIAKLASAFMIMIYMVENICVVVLRETRPQWYKPGYKAPMYPLLQLLGVISGGALLYAMGKIAFWAIISVSVPGLVFYFIYARKRTDRMGVIGMKGKRTDLIDTDNIRRHSNFYDIKRRSQVVVSLFGKERSADMLIEMGMAMAENNHVEAAYILEVPEQTTLQDVMDEPAEVRSLRRRVDAMAHDKSAPISFDPIVSHDVGRSIYEISQCVHCRWLLVEWRGKSRGALTIHNPIGWLKSHLHCNLAIFKDAGVRYIRNIMVLLNDDCNDRIVLETADHLATVNKADVTLMKFIHKSKSQEQKDKAFEELKDISHKLKAFTKVKIIEGPNEVDPVVAETVEYDLFILGSQDPNLANSLFGAYDDILIAKAACSVMAVHADSTSKCD